jgi:cell division protein FtsW
MGSGGILGLGVGSSRFRWDLHAPFSDSIIGIIGEEFGLFGTLFIVMLFAILVYRGLHTALHTSESFGRFVAVGITFWIAFQAFINLAGNVALIPFTGVPLPFISFGGSALVSIMFSCGILINISRQTETSTARTRGSLQRTAHAPVDNRRRDSGARLPGAVRRGSSESGSAD